MKQYISNLRYVYGAAWQYSHRVVFTQAAEVAGEVLALYIAAALPAAVLYFLEHSQKISGVAGGLFGVFAVVAAALTFQGYFSGRNFFQYVDVRSRVMQKVWKKSWDVSYAWRESEEGQEALAKALNTLQSNLNGFEGVFHGTTKLLNSLLGLIVFAANLTALSPLLVAGILVLALIQIAVYRRALNNQWKHMGQRQEIWRAQEYFQSLTAQRSAGKDIRLYRLQKWICGHYDRVNQKEKKLLANEQGMFLLSDYTGIALEFFRDAICYGYLLTRLAQGMDLASFTLALGLVRGISAQIMQAAEHGTKLFSDLRYIGTVKDYMSVQEQKGGSEAVKARQKQEGSRHERNNFAHRPAAAGKAESLVVEAEHLSFCYPNADKPTLEDLSFRLEPGKKTALVGLNGAGKTTLVKILCGLYRPTGGTLTVNGVPIEDMDSQKLWEMLGVIFQKPFVYAGTVFENVTGCDDEKNPCLRDKCREALEQAGLWEKVRTLPRGMDTSIGKELDDSGVLLSGGEFQRLMLARVLYRNASFILLDEPTAAMDALAEQETYELYDRLLGGRTMLMISHRLASTRFCQEILFLENGKITERGTHDQLMCAGGAYAAMFQVQSRYYQEEESHEQKTDDL